MREQWEFGIHILKGFERLQPNEYIYLDGDFELLIHESFPIEASNQRWLCPK